VVVSITYTVREEHREGFVTAMEDVRSARQRTGAVRWGLYRSGETADRFVEVYELPSWDEHLRQHGGRLTKADQVAELRALRHIEGAPEVSHLLPAEAGR
jgi:quinol monooxygenase YgiN